MIERKRPQGQNFNNSDWLKVWWYVMPIKRTSALRNTWGALHKVRIPQISKDKFGWRLVGRMNER